MKRPLSVTIASALLIFMGASSLYATLTSWDDPEVQKALAGHALSPDALFVWTLIGVAVLIGSGLFMLRGVNAARWIYLVYVPIAFVMNVITFGFSMASVPQIAIYVIFVTMLTHSGANRYFRGDRDSDPAEAPAES